MRRPREYSPAWRILLPMLRDKQTLPTGEVWYGRAIGYAKIKKWFTGAYSERTLRRWMAALARAGEVQVVRPKGNPGIKVWLTHPSKRFGKMRDRRERAAQMPLPFDAPPFPGETPVVVEKPVDNNVDMLRKVEMWPRPELRPKKAAQRSCFRILKNHNNLEARLRPPGRAGTDRRTGQNGNRKHAHRLEEYHRLREMFFHMGRGHPHLAGVERQIRELEEWLDREAARSRSA
jgi:hypothetical protein